MPVTTCPVSARDPFFTISTFGATDEFLLGFAFGALTPMSRLNVLRLGKDMAFSPFPTGVIYVDTVCHDNYYRTKAERRGLGGDVPCTAKPMSLSFEIGPLYVYGAYTVPRPNGGGIVRRKKIVTCACYVCALAYE